MLARAASQQYLHNAAPSAGAAYLKLLQENAIVVCEPALLVIQKTVVPNSRSAASLSNIKCIAPVQSFDSKSGDMIRNKSMSRGSGLSVT